MNEYIIEVIKQHLNVVERLYNQFREENTLDYSDGARSAINDIRGFCDVLQKMVKSAMNAGESE